MTDLRLVDANLVAMWAECNAGLGGDSTLGTLRVLRAKSVATAPFSDPPPR